MSTGSDGTAESARILVVDDHPINRAVLTHQLAALGLRAESAGTAQDALRLWEPGGFDVVITDCLMPDVDGHALARAIRTFEARSGRRRTAVIAWTARGGDDPAARAAAGIDDVLPKPASLRALRQVIARWLPPAPDR